MTVALLAGIIGVSIATVAIAERKSKQPGADEAISRASEVSEAGSLASYLTGRIAQKEHDWKTAAPLIHRAWLADRDNAELRHDALLLSIAGGDVAGALEIARVTPPDSGDAPLAGFVQMLDDLAAGRYVAAQARLATTPKTGLDRYLVPLLTAWCEVGRGRKAEAILALAPLESIEGAGELRTVQQALIFEALGDRAEAGSAYAKLLEDKPSTRAIVAAADFYQRAGQTDQARAAIERLDPDGSSASLRAQLLVRLADKKTQLAPPNVRGGAADALFEIASSLTQAQSQDQQQGDIVPLLYTRLALYLQPGFPSGLLLLAESEQKWARFDDAAEALGAIDSKSELRSTADRMAMAMLNKAGEPDKALAVGKAAVEAHPEDVDLALYYADQLRLKSHFTEAVAVYDSTLAKISATSNRRGIVLYHRGIAYQQSHQWPKAETDLLAALQLRPDDPGILNYLAFSWADQGVNLDRARTMLERAIQLVPDDGAIIDSLGWVMYRSGDYNDAVTQLEKAVSLDIDDAEINDHLGDAYWRAGRQIEARAQWDKAQRLTSDKALGEQIRVKLRDGLDQSTAPRRASAD